MKESIEPDLENQFSFDPIVAKADAMQKNNPNDKRKIGSMYFFFSSISSYFKICSPAPIAKIVCPLTISVIKKAKYNIAMAILSVNINRVNS